MKKLIAILAVILMFTVVLTACGKKDKDKAVDDAATIDSASSSASGDVKSATESPLATTVVTETTAKGSTIEKDQEGNVIEIDSSGEIVMIKNADGESVDIPGYLDQHYFVASSGKTYGNASVNGDQSGKSSSQSGASSKSDDKGSASSKEEKESPTEAEIPPYVTEEYELPIL